MGEKTTQFATDLLKLLLANVAVAAIGDAGGLQPSAVPGHLYLSLHSADPGEGGNQTSSEVSYSGYGRIAIARVASEWTFGNGQAVNTGRLEFGLCASGSVTVTHAAVGTAASGPGRVLYRVPLEPFRDIVVGDPAPAFEPEQLIIEES
jgi:hypothetical protein